MHFRQTVLLSMLAAAVTLAGVVCACAVPTVDTDEAAGVHHAHHEHAVTAMDCDHADCGDCMADDAVSKYEALRDHLPQSPQMSFDDEAQVAATLAVNATPLRGFFHQLPVLRLAHAADTAVRRFDKLLN